jgi:catalase
MSKPTTEFDAPFVDNNNIQTAGPRGSALLEDVWFQEKLAHFDGEVIPERRSVNPVLHRGDAALTHQ